MTITPPKPYTKVKDGNVCAVDVDDTIVYWHMPPHVHDGEVVEIRTNGFIEKAIVNVPVVEHIKKMKKRYYSIVIWSAGGSDWAEAVVKALGLEEYVDVIMPKIDEHIDDVRDPKDKLGRWSYIDRFGNVKRESRDGTEVKTYVQGEK